MSIFNKLFGKGKSENDPTKFQQLTKTNYSHLDEMIEQNAGLSFEKQLIFGEVVGSNSWNLDMEKGNIVFGTLEFPIQIIGSLSFNNNSWMWGWGNTQSGIPEHLLVQSNQLKKIGEEKNIRELTERHFTTEEGFQHKVGLLASGIFNSKCYYAANYGQGTLVVTIDDNRIPKIDNNKLDNILTSFPQLISAVELNHRIAFMNYLIDRDLRICLTEHKIEGLRGKKTIVAEFDELDRLSGLSGKI